MRSVFLLGREVLGGSNDGAVLEEEELGEESES